MFPPSPPTFEGVFAEILIGPFGIFNKIDIPFVLCLTILRRSWISVKNQNEFTESLLNLKKDESFRKLTGVINKKYIEHHLGATKLIMNYITTKI